MISPELHFDSVVAATNCTQTKEALLSARRNALVASHRYPLAFKAAMEETTPRIDDCAYAIADMAKAKAWEGIRARCAHVPGEDSKEPLPPHTTWLVGVKGQFPQVLR